MLFLDGMFRRRRAVLLFFLVVTVAFGALAARARIGTTFDQMIPRDHPYMRTYLSLRDSFGGANTFLVGLLPAEGDIFTPEFFKTLESTTDAVLQIPGVDRASVRSLMTPNVRTLELVDGGFAAENVVPAEFSASPEELARVRRNIRYSDEARRLMATDGRGTLIRGALLDADPATGKALDVRAVAQGLEALRRRVETPALRVPVLGFAKAVDDMTRAARSVVLFFLVAFGISVFFLRALTGRWALTGLALTAALAPVLWLVGLMGLFGWAINPLSLLVPFLLFALGLCHAVQILYAWMALLKSGHAPDGAAREALRQTAKPAVLALATDATGFFVLGLIPVPMIREIALAAGVGVALLTTSILLLLPLLLSQTRDREAPALRLTRAERVAGFYLSRLLNRKPAAAALGIAFAIGVGAFAAGQRVPAGPPKPGIPELRERARYNRDAALVARRFPIGLDVFSVYVKGPPDILADGETLHAVDAFAARVREAPGVKRLIAPTDILKMVNVLQNEGFPKWAALPRSPEKTNALASMGGVDAAFLSAAGDTLQILIFTDHNDVPRLRPLRAAVDRAAADLSTARYQFLPGGGNVGVLTAVRDAVEKASWPVRLTIWGIVTLGCLLSFGGARSALIVLIPTLLSAVLANAVMAALDLRLTLPALLVISIGAGVGIDFAVYLYDRYRQGRRGAGPGGAYRGALRSRGRMVVFTALTMAVGVGLWSCSPLKMQADLGGLLGFLFLVNMGAALVLVPALTAFLEPRPPTPPSPPAP